MFFAHVTIAGLDQKIEEKPDYKSEYDLEQWQNDMLKDLKQLEEKIRTKLKNNYVSVRRAFLDLD